MDQVVKTKEDLIRYDGQTVVAVGNYEAIPQPMKGQVKKQLPKDHAVLRLDDGTKVYLEALDSRKSRRREAELEQFNGRRVYVHGTAHEQMPARGQSLIAPCLSDISEIRAAD
jgi:hypothetical protein